MKKYVFTILALALALSFLFVAAPAAHAEEETHSHCVCVNAATKPADHVCDVTIVWEPYVKGMTLVDGGHYYLTQNEGETRNLTSSSNKLNITICLNGFTFRAQTPFKVQNGNTLTICDCKGGGAIRSSQKNGTGYSLWAGYNKGVINLYSGIISGQVSEGVYARPVVVEGGTFNMYGGTIKNGDSGTITTGTPNVGYGGNVLIKNFVGQSTHIGTFNLFGGTIEGGNATADGGNIYVLAGVLNISGGTVKDGSAVCGGNIAANGDGRKVDLTISGGSVENGVATEKGGNIYLKNTTNGCILTLKDTGVITGGKAPLGGNIASYKNNPTTLTGGTISGGIATEKGGNIYVESTDTTSNTFTLDGTTISGGIAKNVETAEDGTETVTWGEGGNIYVGTNSKLAIKSGIITAGEAGNGGNIYIAADLKELQSFVCQITDGIATEKGGNIYSLSALTLGDITVSGGKAETNGGNIFVDKKVLTLNGTTVTGGTALNGGNIAVTNTGAQLIMKDAKVENGSAANTGGNVYTLNVPTVTITGGSISGGNAANHGGNLYITHTSLVKTRRLTISDAKITDGNATDGNGGNLYVAKTGEVTLTNLTMDGGVATNSGSNLYIQNGHIVNISGGTYTVDAGNRKYTYTYPANSDATDEEKEAYLALVAEHGINSAGSRISGNGGNICISSIDSITVDNETTLGTATIDGATITGGNAVNGGALYVGSGTVNIENVTAKSCGGQSGRVLHIAKNGVVNVKNSTLVNWGTMGSAVVNHGTLNLLETVNIPKEYSATEIRDENYKNTLDLLLDTTENESALIDICALEEVDESITVNRYGGEADADGTKHSQPGLVAIGVTDANVEMLTCAHAGYTFQFRDAELHMVNYAVQGMNGKDVVIGYASLADITEDDGATWYIINSDLTEQTINKSIMLDLYGHELSAEIVDGVVVTLIDSANDKYDATACGMLFVTGSGTVETIAHTTVNAGGAVKHYVVLPNEDGSVSAHRYVAAITHKSLKPNQDALGFKASFSADEVARAAVIGYGFNMWVENGDVKTFTKNDGFDGTGHTATLRLQNILAAGGGETSIYGNAFINFNVNGETVTATTSNATTSMKQMIEDVNSNVNEYTQEQMEAVQALVNKYVSDMAGWSIDVIQAWTAPVEDNTTEPAA